MVIPFAVVCKNKTSMPSPPILSLIILVVIVLLFMGLLFAPVEIEVEDGITAETQEAQSFID
jgi:hypothetical protein